jgi:putative intracellular protease/amidase
MKNGASAQKSRSARGIAVTRICHASNSVGSTKTSLCLLAATKIFRKLRRAALRDGYADDMPGARDDR